MSYLRFEELPPPRTRRTRIVDVWSTRGHYLGRISWYTHWRQYAFVPSRETVFNSDCLAEIMEYVLAMMAARKKAA